MIEGNLGADKIVFEHQFCLQYDFGSTLQVLYRSDSIVVSAEPFKLPRFMAVLVLISSWWQSRQQPIR